MAEKAQVAKARTIAVVVYPNAGKEAVEEQATEGGSVFKVWVTEPPEKGRASRAVCRVVAEHLGLAPSCVEIVRGHASRKKLLRIVC